jgi:hypothetical protein
MLSVPVGATVVTAALRIGRLPRACQLLQPEVLHVQTKVRLGQPAEEIIREAAEGRYDLIVVGERRDHDLVTRWLGSTSKRVLDQRPARSLAIRLAQFGISCCVIGTLKASRCFAPPSSCRPWSKAREERFARDVADDRWSRYRASNCEPAPKNLSRPIP